MLMQVDIEILSLDHCAALCKWQYIMPSVTRLLWRAGDREGYNFPPEKVHNAEKLCKNLRGRPQ
jgi:hypothetical protein